MDENGYPTEESLDALLHFEGTPCEFVEDTRALYNGGFVQVADIVDDFGDDVVEIRYVTGGWSGCEDVNSSVSSTMFHMFYWHMSQRGGLSVYHVPARLWNEHAFLGAISRYKGA